MEEITFEDWYGALVELASRKGVSVVADADAWKEDWDNGLFPEEALYSEYPELIKK